MTVRFTNLKKLQETSQIPCNWLSQSKDRITTSRFHEINQKMETYYKNRLKPVMCHIKQLLLSVVQPKELENVDSFEWGKKNEKMQLNIS